MANFTELFTATLNETLAKMVAEAMTKYEVQIVEMQGRIVELEGALENFEREDVDSVVERAFENFDVERAMENAIEGYDFTSIVSDCVDFDGNDNDFASAVKDVIANALR